MEIVTPINDFDFVYTRDTTTVVYPTYTVSTYYERGDRVYDPYPPGPAGNYERTGGSIWTSSNLKYCPSYYHEWYGDKYWTWRYPQENTITGIAGNLEISPHELWQATAAYEKTERVYSERDFHEYECLVAHSAVAPVSTKTTRTSLAVKSTDETIDPSLAVKSTNEAIAARWYDLGPTNPFKMLDRFSTGSTTTNWRSIVAELQGTGKANRLVVVGVDNVKRITLSINGGPNQQFELEYGTQNYLAGETGFYRSAYSIEHPELTDPHYHIGFDRGDATKNIDVKLIYSGMAVELGCTLLDLEVGRQDFSLNDRDQYGNVRFVERGKAKQFRATINFPKERGDFIHKVVENWGSTPIVWNFNKTDAAAKTDYSRLIVHGWAENMSTTISANPLNDTLILDMEGTVE